MYSCNIYCDPCGGWATSSKGEDQRFDSFKPASLIRFQTTSFQIIPAVINAGSAGSGLDALDRRRSSNARHLQRRSSREHLELALDQAKACDGSVMFALRGERLWFERCRTMLWTQQRAWRSNSRREKQKTRLLNITHESRSLNTHPSESSAGTSKTQDGDQESNTGQSWRFSWKTEFDQSVR